MLWVRRSFEGILRRFGFGVGPVPREPVPIRPIGVVRNAVREPTPEGWESVRSDIIVREELMPALDGLEGYSHIIVVFVCHLVPEEERTQLRLRPRNDPRLPEQGVLATRSQLRPSALGVSVVPLLRRRRNVLRVVKPYVPHYDSVPDARVPDWVLHPPTDDAADQ